MPCQPQIELFVLEIETRTKTKHPDFKISNALDISTEICLQPYL